MTVTARDFRIMDVAQGSQEWFAARCGRLTGSAAADVLAKTQKGTEAADRRNLRTKLVVERLTSQPQEDTYVNDAMQWGKDHEADAFTAYTIDTGELATKYGFLAHADLPVGFSPDGIVGDFEGLLELKCPKSATHIGYLKAGVLPAAYKPQVLHGLWVTGAQWCDFCSYDPRYPPHLQLFRVRVERNEAVELEIAAYRECALKFLDEVNDEHAAVLKLRKGAA